MAASNPFGSGVAKPLEPACGSSAYMGLFTASGNMKLYDAARRRGKTKQYVIDVACSAHTVIETPEFIAAAKRSGMTDEERFAAIDYVSRHSEAGEIIEGSGGARKVRIARDRQGKRGGYRVVAYYMDQNSPVFLLTVISKGQQANLTEKQKEQVRISAKEENRRRRQR